MDPSAWKSTPLLLVGLVLATSWCTTKDSAKTSATSSGSTNSSASTTSAGSGGGSGDTTGSTGVGGGSSTTTGSGGSPPMGPFDLCTANAACLVRPKSCCGQNGVATRSDMIAVSSSMAADYARSVCTPADTCMPGPMPKDANLVATCSAGKCQIVDWLTDAATACSVAADCHVRTNECCECGGSFDAAHLVALNATGEAAFKALFCDPDSNCGECPPEYPTEATPACMQGRCVVIWN